MPFYWDFYCWFHFHTAASMARHNQDSVLRPHTYGLSKDQLVLKQLQPQKMEHTRKEFIGFNRGFETRDKTKLPVSPLQGEYEADKRFWTTTVKSLTGPRHISEDETRFTPRSNHYNWSYRYWSIATATIIGTMVLGALMFLIYWYIRRARRRRRMHRMLDISGDPFHASSLSLNEDTSLTLDRFLMKDVLPERASLMFSRSRSPSLAYVMHDIEHNSSNKLSRHSYDASRSNLTKLDCLTRVSMEEPRLSLGLSDRTQIWSLAGNVKVQKVTVDKPLLSMSIAPVTPSSSQVCTLSSAPTVTEESSLLSQDYTLTSQYSCQNLPSSSNSSRVLSNASRASSQLSRSSLRRSTGHSSRKSYITSHSHSPSHGLSSPLGESSSSHESPLF
ncbi:hypothetical protein N7495_005603 [Penicillium taxi]|uniref:uncharacterized protein n=1 Tax=Penicillium taxi TaxID=168475 RepID=UPI002545940A|nr:uncharacterized protein N7495_005603 [Penicillium taxi]KAJ5893912.1 hypothetical protein N7495_005603 [Penicillium taxi]